MIALLVCLHIEPPLKFFDLLIDSLNGSGTERRVKDEFDLQVHIGTNKRKGRRISAKKVFSLLVFICDYKALGRTYPHLS